MTFLGKIRSLIQMFCYTSSDSERFLSWIKARPTKWDYTLDTLKKIDEIKTKEWINK